MTQLLLFPDPKPLVERLGPDFFRRASEKPGVYLMRDRDNTVLYVGKAKNLRKRLGNYRVANQDRMPRRHLRLLRAVHRIEMQECPDEAAALLRESALLRTLKPKFNRAGTWVVVPRYFAWRRHELGLDLAVLSSVDAAWSFCGPLGMAAHLLRTALVRLIWSTLHAPGIASLPQHWLRKSSPEVLTISNQRLGNSDVEQISHLIHQITQGDAETFKTWMDEYTSRPISRFDAAVRELDLETVRNFAERCAQRAEALAEEQISTI